MAKPKNKKKAYISVFSIVLLFSILFMNQQAYAWNITATRVTNRFETYAFNPQIISDSSGGYIIVWEDQRGGSYYDIYAQKFDSNGNKVWAENGTKVSAFSLNQQYPELVTDGAGGAIIVWENLDSLNPNEDDIYAQRIDSTGNSLWTANGTSIASETLEQRKPSIISDNAGGAIITWQDERTGNSQWDIYAQRLDQNGSALWADNGTLVCNAADMQYSPQIVSDGSNGAFISWGDFRPGTNRDIYAQLLNSSGDSQWTSNGLGICTHSAEQYIEGMISDSVGSVIILWEDYRTTGDIYAQRVNTTGIKQWGANGAPIVTTSSEKGWAVLTGDGNGGAFIAWSQGSSSNEDLYAQYINSSGDLQWTSNGIEISSETRSQRLAQIINDGAGGAIIVWQDNRRGHQKEDIYAQRIESDGTTLWGGNGTAIDPLVNGRQLDPQLCFAEVGVAIVTWQDSRTGDIEVYAQYFLDIENPVSNAPESATHEQNSTATIPWILTDNFAGGNYRVLKNGTDYISWANWTSGSNLNIPINTSILGVWNYTIQYNDTLGYWGIPNTVLISINIDTQNPSSNSPGSATYEQGSTATIPWILTDNFAGGFYRVLKNETEYISWTPWTSGSNLNIPIDTSILGDWNYIIQYNDSLGNWGIPNTVLISINTTITDDGLPGSPQSVDGYNPLLLIGTIMIFFIIIRRKISLQRKK